MASPTGARSAQHASHAREVGHVHGRVGAARPSMDRGDTAVAYGISLTRQRRLNQFPGVVDTTCERQAPEQNAPQKTNHRRSPAESANPARNERSKHRPHTQRAASGAHKLSGGITEKPRPAAAPRQQHPAPHGAIHVHRSRHRPAETLTGRGDRQRTAHSRRNAPRRGVRRDGPKGNVHQTGNPGLCR